MTTDDKRSLSPTALGNYMTCGRRGQYYHSEDVPRYTTIGLALGSAYHHGLEVFGDVRLAYGDEAARAIDPTDLFERTYAIAGGYLREATQRDDFVQLDGDDDLDTSLSKLATMLNVWASNPGYHWLEPNTSIMGVEIQVAADFGSDTHFFIGYIDAAYEVEDYGVVLTDYKTAGRAWGGSKKDGDPRKLIQAPLYAEAWYQQTGVEPAAFSYDVMTYGGKFHRVFVDVSAPKRGPFIERWLETSRMVAYHEANDLPLPTNPESNLCSPKYCGYWDLCPMGAALTNP